MIHAPYFEWLIHPISVSDFFRNNWERTPLHIQRHERDFFLNLFNLHTLDKILSIYELNLPEIGVASSKGVIPVSEYTTPAGRIDSKRLYQLFINGVTIFLNRMNKRVPELGEFCEKLEAELSYKFQTNIYLTPSNNQGFLPHFDDHDVFILQVEGSKYWKLYDTPVELPLKTMEFYPSVCGHKDITWEGIIEAGDVLYIPRGIIHSASATDKISLHITAAVKSKTVLEYLMAVINKLADEDSSFRKYLPPGFASQAFDRSMLRSEFYRLSQSMIDNGHPDAAIDFLIDEVISSHNIRTNGQLYQMLSLSNIELKTRCSARENLIFRKYLSDKHIHLLCQGTEIILPWYAEEAIDLAMSGVDFQVCDLPGGLDDNAKITVVRRLIQEGILKIPEK